MRSIRCAVAALLLIPALAGGAEAGPRDVAIRVAERFAVPRYQALAASARAEAKRFATACAAPGDQAIAEVKAGFHATADAWNAVALLRYGPVADDFRAENLYHWPERKNATTKALVALLSGSEAVTVETIAGSSAGLQGLPALERVLFEDGATFSGPGGARRCAIGAAIAGNIARMADDIVTGWTGNGGLMARLRGGDDASAVEAVTRFATDYVTSAQFNTDTRISPVLGTGPTAAKPQAGEMWRSGRSSRALRLETEAAHDLLLLLIEGGTGIDKAVAASADTRRIAATLPPDFAAAAQDAAGRKPFVALRDAIREARDEAVKAMPGALGITLGFNSLDGD